MKPNSAVKKAVTNIDYIKGFMLNFIYDFRLFA